MIAVRADSASAAEAGGGKEHPLGTERSRVARYLEAGSYLALNVASATCIVFANKTVLTTLRWHFVYALTLVHVAVTLAGLRLFAALGWYERKALPVRPLLSLAAAFVGYIVFWNVSLQVNSVGFYQLSKICITPGVVAFEAFVSRQLPTRREVLAICVLCTGVALATVTDPAVATNLLGLLVGAAAVAFTSVYQVFAGSKQRQLEVGSLALMAGYTPVAGGMLAALVPLLEPVGLTHPTPDTLLGFPYTPMVVGVIALTAVLGLLVSLSTFLTIGATSSVTYNVVGHVKTVIVLAGGCLLFGEEMPLQRLLGISLAMAGIVWYSLQRLQVSAAAAKERDSAERESLLRAKEEEVAEVRDKPAGGGQQRTRSLAPQEAAAAAAGQAAAAAKPTA